MSNNEEERIDLITLGNTTVGKTSYILKYVDNCFQQVYLTTMGIDFKVKTIELNNKKYKIFFFDTTGEERFKTIAVNAVKSADGILLMYDITKRPTFEAISGWMKSVSQFKDDNFPKVLIGNKCDLENKREVSKQEGEELAKIYNIDFYEISNKEGINVEESCLALVNKVIEFKKELKTEQAIKLEKKIKENNEKSKCC